MLIFEYNKLKNKQLKDIKELVSACNAYEGLERFPILENDNLYEDMNCFYLYYEENKLISALIIDQPAFSEAEITGYTLPAFRRQGYFYELLEKAMNELAYYDIYKIVIVAEPKSKSGTAAATALADYEYSEYMLLHDLSQTNKENINTNIRFEEIREVDTLDRSINCPDDSMNESMEAAKIAIQTDRMLCLLAYLKEEPAGICSVSLEGDRAYLFGLYVLEKYRRKGIGYSFVQEIINISHKAEKKGLMLQVGNNTKALNLYLKSGFHIIEKFDYYVFYTEA